MILKICVAKVCCDGVFVFVFVRPLYALYDVVRSFCVPTRYKCCLQINEPCKEDAPGATGQQLTEQNPAAHILAQYEYDQDSD